MYKFSKNSSIVRDYFLISSIIFAVVVILSISFSIYSYKIQKDIQEHKLATSAERLKSVITESFEYVSHLSGFIGDQVVEHAGNNKYKIADILGGKLLVNDYAKKLFSWTMFDWVMPDDKLVASGPFGVLKKPKDVSFRAYAKMAKKEPGKLHFDQPSIGIPSGKYIIPMGMGILDKAGKYIGIVSLGFSISDMTRRLEDEVIKDGVSFLVISDQSNIVFQSSDNKPITDNENLFKETNFSGSLFPQNSGYFDKPIYYHGIVYSYYRKIDNYPYTILVGFENNLNNAIIRNLLLPRLLEFFVIGVVAIVMLLVMRSFIIKPILDLSNVAEQIAKGELNKVRLPKVRTRELYILAKQIARVQSYWRRNNAIKLELEQKSKELQLAHEAAVNANLAKTEFLSSTAHELRSPLNAIICMSEVIKTKMFGDDVSKYVEYAGDIEQSGHELLEFINDLIDLSKTENGNFSLDNQEMLDIENIIQRAVKLNISRAHKSSINIRLNVDQIMPKLYGDGRRIRQILVNLISNSIKYSQTNTVISISANIKDGKMVLVVADQGFGMNEEQIKVALQKWGTLENQNSGKVDSSGLGLTIAKHLAELHGAEFVVNSEVGKGTTITIMFPQDRLHYVLVSEKEIMAA
ncbi:MAG: rpfC [Rickettsiaceae bacterium]|jgi:two-component system sensor histidine kinase ChiS|nr:rpfC [Rickettsiaceae bacterium]